MGSIFRTADAVGATKLYLAGITPAPIDRFGRARQQLTKVSLGAEKYLPWEKARSAARLIRALKKQGCKIYALEQSPKAVPYHRLRPKGGYRFARIALVVGNEVRGLPRAVLNLADQVLEIPMYGRKESLNVAVAFGVVAFHLRHTSP